MRVVLVHCLYRRCAAFRQRRDAYLRARRRAVEDIANASEVPEPARGADGEIHQTDSIAGNDNEQPWQPLSRAPPANGRERLRALAVLGSVAAKY